MIIQKIKNVYSKIINNKPIENNIGGTKGEELKSKFLPTDYKEELANVAENKGFSQTAENLLLSMVYKIEDGYDNYATVKREVPTKSEFLENLVRNVKRDCDSIEIAEPKSELEQELKKNKCRIMTERDIITKRKKVISYPNEANLLYALKKMSLQPINDKMSVEEQAIMTAVNIGKCISTAELIRDFNGWTWSILEDEIESTECNIIYIFLSILLGYKYLDNCDVKRIQNNISTQLFFEIKKVATQFYMSYDQKQNEEILKKIYNNKKKLEKMKDQSSYVVDIAQNKKKKLADIKKIDEVLNDPRILRQQYMDYNSKRPDEQKIFSVSHYEEKLQKERQKLLDEIENYNKMQNPIEFVKAKDELQYEIKFYEEKTDISKLQKEFLKCFEQRIEQTTDRRRILDMIYEVRYLNYLPNCKMKLTTIEQMLIPKAIRFNVIAPISNNDSLDYRILKGIFESQVISLENLFIKLSSEENKIHVDIYDGEMIEKSYDVKLPEGSTIQIRRSKKMKIFG